MEPDRIRASEWILKHKMGTNRLHFHRSVKVSAPEVAPLEGAVSARRVTRAVYFPHARGRERERGRARALLVEPVDSPRSASDTAINHAPAAASGCVRVRACASGRAGV